MDKRKLSKIEREKATPKMVELAGRLDAYSHMATARLIEENKILLLNFYEISELSKGNTDAVLRTFLSKDDYITQDLESQKVKWLTASFSNMNDIGFIRHIWMENDHKFRYDPTTFIRSSKEKKLIRDFFAGYEKGYHDYYPEPWNRVANFQDEVMKDRLAAKYKKETEPIDAKMATVHKPPQGFFDWVWETGMSFSRYVLYKETQKGKAECECTYCKKKGVVERKETRLRNNEKGNCPFCNSPVTFKARGKMPSQSADKRWFVYVDPTEDGFVYRYFHAIRTLRSDKDIEWCADRKTVSEFIGEYSRAFYTFPDGKPQVDSYEYTTFRQSGKTRWCHDNGVIACLESILYPGNLPQAWKHTPMKYSALEVLSSNIPTEVALYEKAIGTYLKFPKLEWVCKMGLNQLAKHIIYCGAGSIGRGVGKIRYQEDSIYDILGLTKVNTRILQEIDGGDYELKLLQVAQEVGIQFKPEQLKEYYETFECNTDLLRATKRKTSLHKLVKYITKESENYPMGDRGHCWRYAYMQNQERTDPRIDKKRNCAKDWLEYLEWCKELKYDLDNMFYYMPNNFKKVHDRTAKEYQALLDKKAAEEKRRLERKAALAMEKTKKAMAEIFEQNEGVDAFSIKGKGLILVVPKTLEEIKAEGENLHHCVGTYVERVAQGKTNIFFIRKEAEPNKSYFTMEWKDNKIAQCRGLRNCDMPPEVKGFVNAFEKKMIETIQKGESVGRRKKKNLQHA